MVHKHTRKLRLVTGLAAAAGVIYNSWIIGYWFNPVVAKNDLASELEALHQPFNWFFVLCDIISSTLAIVVAIIVWRHRRGVKLDAIGLLAVVNFGIFGIGTIVDALLPLHCDPTSQLCPITIHDPLLIAHGFFSILASLCLFIAVVAGWWVRRSSLLMNSLIVGYILFTVFSAISLITPGQDSWAQHYSLLLDGICLAAVPYALIRSAPSTVMPKLHLTEGSRSA